MSGPDDSPGSDEGSHYMASTQALGEDYGLSAREARAAQVAAALARRGLLLDAAARLGPAALLEPDEAKPRGSSARDTLSGPALKAELEVIAGTCEGLPRAALRAIQAQMAAFEDAGESTREALNELRGAIERERERQAEEAEASQPAPRGEAEVVASPGAPLKPAGDAPVGGPFLEARAPTNGADVPAGGEGGELPALPPAAEPELDARALVDPRPFGEPPGAPPGLDLSASRLSLWARCPEALARRYGLGERPKLKPPAGDEALIGTAVHNVLWEATEARLRKAIPQEQLALGPELAERLERWAPSDPDLHREAKLLLERCAPVNLRRAVAAELPWSRRIAGVVVGGALDRVDREHDVVVIVDYKTGAPKKRAELAWEPKTVCYLYDGRRRWPDARGWKVAYHYLDAGIVQEVEWTPERDRFAYSLVRSYLSTLALGRFEARPGPSACTHCDARAVCEPFARWADAQPHVEAAADDLEGLARERHQLHAQAKRAEKRLEVIDPILQAHLDGDRRLAVGHYELVRRTRKREGYSVGVVRELAKARGLTEAEAWAAVGSVKESAVRRLASETEEAAEAADRHALRSKDLWLEVRELTP